MTVLFISFQSAKEIEKRRLKRRDMMADMDWWSKYYASVDDGEDDDSVSAVSIACNRCKKLYMSNRWSARVPNVYGFCICRMMMVEISWMNLTPVR